MYRKFKYSVQFLESIAFKLTGYRVSQSNMTDLITQTAWHDEVDSKDFSSSQVDLHGPLSDQKWLDDFKMITKMKNLVFNTNSVTQNRILTTN